MSNKLGGGGLANFVPTTLGTAVALSALLASTLGDSGLSSNQDSLVLNTDFTNTGQSLPSAYTFTRASAATDYASTGLLQTVSSGVLRAFSLQEYNPTTLAPLGAVIEEQRTNLLLQSNDTTNAVWSKTNVTSTSITAIRGFPGSQTVAGVAGATLKALLPTSAVTVTAGSVYTCYAVIKYRDARYVSFTFDDTTTTNGVWAVFDLQTGVISKAAATYGTGASAAASITSWGGGVYLLTLSGTAGAAATSARWALSIQPTGTSQFSSFDTTTAFDFIHGQLELGSFYTSPVLTTTTTATRLADSLVASNIWSGTEGTVVIWFRVPAEAASKSVLTIGDGTVSNRIIVNTNSGRAGVSFRVVSGGSDQCDIPRTTAWTAGQLLKVAARFKANDFAVCFNGGAVGTHTSGSVPTVSNVYVGSNGVSTIANATIERVTVLRRALTNAQLQALTS